MFAASPVVPFSPPCPLFFSLIMELKFINRGRNFACCSSAIFFYSPIRFDDLYLFPRRLFLFIVVDDVYTVFSLSLSLSLFLSRLSFPRFIILRLRWPSTRRRVAIDFKIRRRTPCAPARCRRRLLYLLLIILSVPCAPSHFPVSTPVSAIAAAEPAALHGDMVQEFAARTAKW